MNKLIHFINPIINIQNILKLNLHQFQTNYNIILIFLYNLDLQDLLFQVLEALSFKIINILMETMVLI